MPVVSRQWAAISHFQEKLVTGALKALASPNVAPVVCCLLCYYSLSEENMCYSILTFCITLADCCQAPVCLITVRGHGWRGTFQSIS